MKLIPALAKQNGLDPGKVEFTNMAPNLQEQMLIRGQVDVSAIFTATSYMNLVALKLDPDKDFRWISYADAGLDLYSSGVMVSPKFLREKPDAVKGLVRAINRALKECVASPDAAIAVLTKAEPLINTDIEKRRLTYVYDTLIATPEAARLGIGDVDDAPPRPRHRDHRGVIRARKAPRAVTRVRPQFLAACRRAQIAAVILPSGSTHPAINTSRTASATILVAAFKSLSRKFSLALWAFASRMVRGPAP